MLLRHLPLLFAFPVLASAASFDCGKVTSRMEKMICGSPTLSALDESLAAAYKAAGKDRDNGALSLDQRQWLKNTRDACRDAACVEKAGNERLALLTRWHEPEAPNDSIYGNYVLAREISFYSPQGSSVEKADDCLVIKKGRNGIDFSINLIQSNGHTCSIDGSATLAGNVYSFVPGKDQAGLANCQLRLKVKRHTIELEDADGACRAYACGMRAGLDRIEFLRSRKVAKSCANPG